MKTTMRIMLLFVISSLAFSACGNTKIGSRDSEEEQKNEKTQNALKIEENVDEDVSKIVTEDKTAYLDVLKKYKGNIKSWERRIKEYNEWYQEDNVNSEFLYDERQIAITDINGDGIDELLFVADTDAQTNEGWEEYTKDLYIFTLQNGQASKVFQERVYTEAGGGYRYLVIKTTDNQLVVLDTGVDEFEECSMDQYRLIGDHLEKEEHTACRTCDDLPRLRLGITPIC